MSGTIIPVPITTDENGAMILETPPDDGVVRALKISDHISPSTGQYASGSDGTHWNSEPAGSEVNVLRYEVALHRPCTFQYPLLREAGHAYRCWCISLYPGYCQGKIIELRRSTITSKVVRDQYQRSWYTSYVPRHPDMMDVHAIWSVWHCTKQKTKLKKDLELKYKEYRERIGKNVYE
ncbi:hypothetical protein ACRALDRAFT_211809 [Sodiomyces alcalophilus JCM 7366]|uniref:uncharacterized protein n=1 Tax=Sodiomyces alcalophilus JCM 7366 TaxID=591952 RepID=UPI0039B4B367